MKQELDKLLCERYPKMMVNRNLPMQETCMCWGFECGNGWFPLIKDLITDLIELGWDKQTCQVKEKFGGLRFYINGASEEIYKRIQTAEDLSYETCETCGERGELKKIMGWYTTLCDKHYEEHKSNIQK